MSTHQYGIYRRGDAEISLLIQDPPRGGLPPTFNLESVKRRIKDTLDFIPESHINLFGNKGYVRLGNIPSTGGGHNPTTPYIRLSYDSLDGSRGHSYNNGRLSYTLLHEMGHIVDKSINPTCMDILKRDFPLGCWAILTRYHDGATSGPSEHYADIYADYFYNERAGLDYRVNRRRPGNGLTCGCGHCNNWCRRFSRRVSGNLPTTGRELTLLRYEALLRSPPFAGITAQNRPSPTRSVTDSSGVAAHASYRVPRGCSLKSWS